MLTRIGLATRMMDLIVGNVLDYTNIEEGSLTPSRRTIDPNSSTVEVASESLRRAQRKHVRFHTELKRVPAVNCDPHHLERILKNLMINAIVLESMPTNSRRIVKGSIQPGVPSGASLLQYPRAPFARIPEMLKTMNVMSPRASVVARLPVTAPPIHTASLSPGGLTGAKGGIIPTRFA